MGDLPLHPAVVHLPIGLAVAWPLACAVLLLALARGWLPARAWWGAVGLGALLAAGALAAVETGEDEHEVVEDVVSHDLVEEHEEWGERVLWAAAAGLLLSLAGVRSSGRGVRAARWATLAVSLLVLGGILQTGHLGGRLVYVHGAASAYVEPGATAGHDHEH